MSKIAGVGMYVPDNILTSQEIEQRLNIEPGYAVARSGIEARHLAPPEMAASDLGSVAGERALKSAGLSPAEIDLVITTTITPDMHSPATACIIQDRLGLVNAAAFDLNAACTGFIYALAFADQLIAAGMYKNIMIVSAEVLSKLTNWSDPETCILFGDGAGAVVLTPAEPGAGILSSKLGSNGAGKDFLYIPAGGSRMPITEQVLHEHLNTAKMSGMDVFKFAMLTAPEVVLQALSLANLTLQDVSLIIPHQANLKIIHAIARRLDFPEEQFMVNLEKYGNTSSATIPIALFEALQENRIKSGDIIVMVGFGAGLTWGASVIRW